MAAGSTAFFTLRRPLARGERRTLNLFEPRYLHLMDTLAAERLLEVASGGVEDGGGGAAAADEARLNALVGATFGCLLASNRLYLPADGSSLNDPTLKGGTQRVADVVVGRLARRVCVVSVEEGVRPVSGNRKLRVVIVGESLLRVDAETLQPTVSYTQGIHTQSSHLVMLALAALHLLSSCRCACLLVCREAAISRPKPPSTMATRWLPRRSGRG